MDILNYILSYLTKNITLENCNLTNKGFSIVRPFFQVKFSRIDEDLVSISIVVSDSRNTYRLVFEYDTLLSYLSIDEHTNISDVSENFNEYKDIIVCIYMLIVELDKKIPVSKKCQN